MGCSYIAYYTAFARQIAGLNSPAVHQFQVASIIVMVEWLICNQLVPVRPGVEAPVSFYILIGLFNRSQSSSQCAAISTNLVFPEHLLQWIDRRWVVSMRVWGLA